jgi:hypothetical protein
MLDKNWPITLLICTPLPTPLLRTCRISIRPGPKVNQKLREGSIFKVNLWKFHRVGTKSDLWNFHGMLNNGKEIPEVG